MLLQATLVSSSLKGDNHLQGLKIKHILHNKVVGAVSETAINISYFHCFLKIALSNIYL